MGEFPLFGVPAVLVPYPWAWRYQKVNADFLVAHGAAVLMEDDKMASQLKDTLRNLMRDKENRAKMGQAMRALAHPDAAARIAKQMLTLVEE